MDANNRESAADVSASTATAARMKKSISERAADAKDAVNDLGRRATDKWDNSRRSTADALEKTATSLHSGAEQFSGIGHTAAERLEATAEYVRETDLHGIMQDFQDLVRRYPAQSLAGAGVLGFLVACGLRGLAR